MDSTNSSQKWYRNWLKTMFPVGSDSDSMFEALRKVYVALPETPTSSTYINLSTDGLPSFPGQLEYLLHDATTTYASSSVRSRSVSGSADSLPVNLTESLQSTDSRLPMSSLPRVAVLSAVLSAGLAQPFDAQSCAYNALHGGCVGVAAHTVKALFQTTPIVGETVSLGMLGLSQRSHLCRLRRSEKISEAQYASACRESLAGSIGAISASRLGVLACQRLDQGETVTFLSSIGFSILGSFLARRLVSFTDR